MPAVLERRLAVEQHHDHAGQDGGDQREVEIALGRRLVVEQQAVHPVAQAVGARREQVALERVGALVAFRLGRGRVHAAASAANASRAAASVASITAASWAADMKPASNADGAR